MVVLFTFIFGISLPGTVFAAYKRNLVRNGEFDKKMRDWELFLRDTAGSIGGMKVVKGKDMSGDNALEIDIKYGGPTMWDVQLNQPFVVQSGKTYSISLMAKADKNRVISIGIQQGDAPYTLYFRQDITLTTEVKSYGPFQFTADVDDVGSFFRLSMGGPEAVVCLIDKIEVYDVTGEGDDMEVSGKEYQNLELYKGVHPRLYVDFAKVKEVRKAIASGGTYERFWMEVKEQADRFAVEEPTEYKYQDDMLWQREVGNKMATLAAAYLFGQDKKYLEAAKAWALKACSYPTWGTTNLDNKDLEAGHLFMGLALVYDWCYQELDDGTRETIRSTILKRGQATYEATNTIWWRVYFLNNHTWVNLHGLVAAGLAVYDEAGDVLPWFSRAEEIMNTTMDVLGDDGYNLEGYPYMEYGVEYLLRYMDLSRKFFGTNMYETEWFKKNVYNYIYLSLPMNSWRSGNRVVNIGDGPREDWYGPDTHLRKYAAEYKNGYAQWLANRIDERNLDNKSSQWLNLIWYDPSVEEKGISDLDTFYHFKDMDVVVARSEWSGDESMVVFKSGPYIGHEAFEKNPGIGWGAGHVHPDAGHFIVYGNGEWLLRDDGYAQKYTSHHNTLLVNGKGQVGEGAMWFDEVAAQQAGATAHIKKAESTSEMDYMVGDATLAYPKDLGLTKFVRHIVFVKPNVIIVVDDIEQDREQPLELRFFPEQQIATRQADGGYYIPGINTNLRIVPLTPDGVEVKAEPTRVEFTNVSGNPRDILAIKLQTQKKKWRNAVAISFSDAQSIPPVVSYSEEGNVLKFEVDHQVVTLDINNETVGLKEKENSIKVMVDGMPVQFDVPPTIVNNRTMVPMRKIFEALGAEVQWDERTGTITAKKEHTTIVLKTDSNDFVINGETGKLDVPVMVQDGTALVPVRFISESLGAKVLWKSSIQTVDIRSQGYDSNGDNSNADLATVSINGKPVKNFTPDKVQYDVTRLWNASEPAKITCMPYDLDASLEIQQTVEDGNVIKVHVTSADGSNQKVYTFNIQPLKGVGDLEIFEVTASDTSQKSVFDAFDNDFESYWTAEGNGHWLMCDLGKTTKVSAVSIASLLGDKRSIIFEIQVSNDGNNWSTVYSGQSSGKTLEPEIFDFDDVEARYVRYVGYGNTSNAFNSITEFGIK